MPRVPRNVRGGKGMRRHTFHRGECGDVVVGLHLKRSGEADGQVEADPLVAHFVFRLLG